MANARSRIQISFEFCILDNKLCLLEIVARFINKQNDQFETIHLGLIKVNSYQRSE